ncbi:hypothetical protein IFR04_011309 [Cadophora malorum]|uniref:Uncharacterized protein n=1 Tax=Cadophora malorum TaxID=108018 RepID=A0A8H7T683_9HELO|nr:hypothetical protein IFR04_011309 [Cadophora malorum]
MEETTPTSSTVSGSSTTSGTETASTPTTLLGAELVVDTEDPHSDGTDRAIVAGGVLGALIISAVIIWLVLRVMRAAYSEPPENHGATHTAFPGCSIPEVGGRSEEDEFVKILCTAAESCGPEPLKEPAIYALSERKEGNPIWTWRTDLQDWVESKRAADNLLRTCMEREKNERAQFYAAHGIREEPESRDRVEDKRARVYGKKANAPSTEDRTFPFVGASVSRAIQAEAQPAVKVEAQPAKVEAQDGFDPTSFLSFTAWYEKKHNLKLGADPAELTKLMAAFKTIQDALSI